MIRLILVALGGWAAWRYRSQIKEYANQLPQVRRRAVAVLGEAREQIKEGFQPVPDTTRPAPSSERDGQTKR